MKKTIKITIFILLILVSLMLIFNNQLRNIYLKSRTKDYIITNISSEQIQKNIEQTSLVSSDVKDEQYENSQPEIAYDFNQVEALSSERVAEIVANNIIKETPNYNLSVTGGIAIPDLGINLPIFLGVANETLYYGAGTMKPNQQMGKGNYALASHHLFDFDGASDMLFSPLDRAEIGMKIHITDKTNVYTYEIKSVEVVDPTAVYVIHDNITGSSEITLVTCTDTYATQRIVVKGDLISQTSWDSSDESILRAFEI